MSNTTWSTSPDSVLGTFAARPVHVGSRAAAPVAAPAGTPAPAYGTGVPSARLRALLGGMPVGAAPAADVRHIDDIRKQNTSTLGIHSPGRSPS